MFLPLFSPQRLKKEPRMKKIVATIAALSFAFAATAFAAGPETMTLNAKPGNVTFPHAKHQKDLGISCKECHGAKPGKIEGFGKDKAHELCKGCHAKKNPDTAKCSYCHKK